MICVLGQDNKERSDKVIFYFLFLFFCFFAVVVFCFLVGGLSCFAFVFCCYFCSDWVLRSSRLFFCFYDSLVVYDTIVLFVIEMFCLFFLVLCNRSCVIWLLSILLCFEVTFVDYLQNTLCLFFLFLLLFFFNFVFWFLCAVSSTMMMMFIILINDIVRMVSNIFSMFGFGYSFVFMFSFFKRPMMAKRMYCEICLFCLMQVYDIVMEMKQYYKCWMTLLLFLILARVGRICFFIFDMAKNGHKLNNFQMQRIKMKKHEIL